MKKSIAIFFCFAVAALPVYAQKKNPPPPPPPPVIETTKFNIAPPAPDLDTLYAKNPSVTGAWYNGKQHLVVELKDGSTEEYNLQRDDRFRAFVEKYRCLPPAPAHLPPSPPPPVPRNIQ